MTKGDHWDPKALIAEAYRISGISEPECKSIFLDWALSLPQDLDQTEALTALIDRAPDAGHPMTTILKEGLAQARTPRRRGGAMGRRHTT